MFTQLIAWLQGVWNKMFPQSTLQQTLGLNLGVGLSDQNVMSARMITELQKWSLMYVNQADWLTKDIISLNLPAAISSEVARTVTIEMIVEVSGSARADFLQTAVNKVVDDLRLKLELGIAKGGLILKPYVDNDQLCTDYIQADAFYPISFDGNGQLQAVAFINQLKQSNYWYTRFELHQMQGTNCLIRNIAYRSSTQGYIGSQVPLTEVQQWAAIEPEATVSNIIMPLFGYFRYPQANNIEPTSPLGVSIYSRAVDLIRQADEQWGRLVWEFESGERALYVDTSAFRRDKDGKPILPHKRLYRTLQQVNSPSVAEPGFYKEWSPKMRGTDFANGFNGHMRRIEFNCGLSYGILSDPQIQALTATEIKASQQRYYSTVTDTQKALRVALEHWLYAADIYATLYNLAPAGSYSAAYSFDDSIVTDHDAQFAQDKISVDLEAMSLIEFRMRTYGETKEIAIEKLKLIQEEKQFLEPAPAPAPLVPVPQSAYQEAT